MKEISNDDSYVFLSHTRESAERVKEKEQRHIVMEGREQD